MVNLFLVHTLEISQLFDVRKKISEVVVLKVNFHLYYLMARGFVESLQ
jgi:hypothetical protein